MYHFKNNYALEVSSIDKAVDFYQQALGLIMYKLDKSNTECVLENPLDKMQLMLSQRDGIIPFSITIFSEHISDAMSLHSKLGIVKKSYPREARYSIADPDGNIIHIHAEAEKMLIKNSEKSEALDDDPIEGLDDIT